MKLEARLFLGVGAFFVAIAIMYGIWTKQDTSFSRGQLEWAGLAALILCAGLMGLTGGFFWFISRRIDARPEDRPDAEISESAGELGFFSPGSYWPLGVAAAATTVGIGLAFVQVWLIIIGIAVLLFVIGGLLFEYYIGGHRPLQHR